jgi:enoyl-CoA hydratase
VFRHLRIEERGELALVRIDRPPANALDLELLEEGSRALEELRSAEPAAVVITGRNGYFSAGVDLTLVPTLDPAGQRQMVEGINRLFAGWYAFPRPVVSAVNGHAIAGGLILALCGDYRVAATEGKLGLTELRAGVPYPAVAMAVVRAELGPVVARTLVLRAHLIEPREALELGVVDELQPPEDVLERAVDVAKQLAELPGSGYGLIKRQLRGETIELAEQVVASGADPALASWLGEETRDAAAAVLGRSPERPPSG